MGTRTPSLPLFKEEMQQLKKGERLGQKTLSLPLFNADGKSMLTGIRGDESGPMGHALLNETTPKQGASLTEGRPQRMTARPTMLDIL